MKIICISIFSLLLITNNSCTVKSNISSDELNKFSKIKQWRNISKIYVIPNAGCTGCINKVESIAQSSSISDSVFFIFTRINSMKQFKNKFGTSFIEQKNIILDTSNLFHYLDEEYNIYPVLYKKVEENILLVKYFKP